MQGALSRGGPKVMQNSAFSKLPMLPGWERPSASQLGGPCVVCTVKLGVKLTVPHCKLKSGWGVDVVRSKRGLDGRGRLRGRQGWLHIRQEMAYVCSGCARHNAVDCKCVSMLASEDRRPLPCLISTRVGGSLALCTTAGLPPRTQPQACVTACRGGESKGGGTEGNKQQPVRAMELVCERVKERWRRWRYYEG